MRYQFLKICISTCIAALLIGCASNKNTFGSSVKAEGEAVAAIGKKWDKGQAMIKKGNKLVRKGNEQIGDGEENVADGKAMVKTGQKLVEEAEAAYAKEKAPIPAQ